MDGRAIANHMTKKAPKNLIMLECCMSMQTELFCKPMREKGVAVVFGFSESVISFGADMMIDAVAQSLCSGRTMAQAFNDMQTDIGRWDPIFYGFSLSLAQSSDIAFPIVVSEEDAYPGVGKVNQVQTVKSGWMLPVRTDMPQKLTLPLGFNIGSRTIAYKKKVVNDREWRYNAWFSSPAACYVIEKPIPGYQTKYVNVGVYAHVTDRCCDGGTIINKKIPKTGDESNLVLWTALMLVGIAGLTTLVLMKKRGKAGK